MHDALYFLLSPTNVVSITKLRLDAKDKLLNIQTYPTYFIFTWNNRENVIQFHYDLKHLLELSLFDSFHPLHYLTTDLKVSITRLSKDNKIKSFENMLSNNLHQLINTLQLSPLEI